jgi:hypothetical protein
MSEGPGGDRPLTLVFFLLHAGFVRFYGPTIELLAERGHRVHLAFSRMEKGLGDTRLAEELAARHDGVTIGLAPERARADGWRAIAGASRSLLDLARYADPRFAGAPKLRARVAETVAEQIRSALPPAAPFAPRLVQLVSTRSPAATARLSRLLAAVERSVPPSESIDSALRRFAPDAVLVSPVVDFGSSQVEYVKSAAGLGIPSAVCVASWDNLTGKGLIRVPPDRVFVWNEAQRHEAIDLHGIPADRVVATGSPKFDEWFDRRPSTTARAFAARVGLHEGFLLYLCSSPFIAPDEVPFVRDWLRALRSAADERLAAAPVLIRPHPQNAAQWAGADLSDLGPVEVWPAGGAQPDEGDARADFYDSLAHADAVIGINTSALIEAAIVGRQVFTVLDGRFAETQEGTLHFHHLRAENGGFLHEARSFDEHLAQLARLGGGVADERTRAFVEAFVRPHGRERAALPILVDEIERLARRPAEPRHTPVSARVLRAALRPLAALGSLLARRSR